jgi:pullulanase/glycogen debranching enzyme
MTTSMKPDILLSRSLADSLLEVVQACQNKKRMMNHGEITQNEAQIWFHSLDKEHLNNILTSREPEWLTILCEMVNESRRVVKGDENLYSVDEELSHFGNNKPGRKKVMNYHRRYEGTEGMLHLF